MTRADLLRVVEDAILAPSIHNTQPWLFRISGDTVEPPRLSWRLRNLQRWESPCLHREIPR
jgi:hypothetical protein